MFFARFCHSLRQCCPPCFSGKSGKSSAAHQRSTVAHSRPSRVSKEGRFSSFCDKYRLADCRMLSGTTKQEQGCLALVASMATNSACYGQIEAVIQHLNGSIGCAYRSRHILDRSMFCLAVFLLGHVVLPHCLMLGLTGPSDARKLQQFPIAAKGESCSTRLQRAEAYDQCWSVISRRLKVQTLQELIANCDWVPSRGTALACVTKALLPLFLCRV